MFIIFLFRTYQILFFNLSAFVSEGFKLGPIKERLPDISFGKIKLALAQMEKSTGQVIQEVMHNNTFPINVKNKSK